MFKFLVCVAAFGGVCSRRVLETNLGDKPLYEGHFAEGDIARRFRNDRNAMLDMNRLWPNATVPFVIGESAEVIRSYILDGMEDYHQHTCVRFVPWEPHMGNDYIRIEWYEGCWSLVGREGGEQFVSLGTGCHWKGLVVHELGHAIGFNHEQSRADRDDYIEIIWENILDDFVQWFQKDDPWAHNLLGEAFDYQSIMLYEEEAFSKNGLPTVRVKQPGGVIGPVWKKPGLSESDKRRVNKLYQCFGAVRPPNPAVPDYTCNFEKDDCAIVNQENMGAYFERKTIKLGGRVSSILVLDRKDGNVGARLITPYYEIYGRKSNCLTLEYYSDGSAITEINIVQQGFSTNRIAQLNTKTNEQWIQQKFMLSMPEKTRFFLEVMIDSREPYGTVAFDNILYSVDNC